MRVGYGECMPRWKLIKSWKRRQASIYLRINPPHFNHKRKSSHFVIIQMFFNDN